VAPPEVVAHETDEAEDPPWVDLGRLVSLSDGIFAFAMTLLVIELVVPVPATSLSGSALEGFLGAKLRSDQIAFEGYAFAFTMIAIWWMSHQRLFLRVRRANQAFQWMNMAFLMAVSVTPFVLGLLVTGNDSGTFLGVAVFLGTESATSLLLSGMWYYATEGHRLVDPGLSERAIQRARAITLSRSGIFLGAFALAFWRPDIGLDALGLIYVFQIVQARRGKVGTEGGPITSAIHELRTRRASRRAAPKDGAALPDGRRPPG
jgi:uncharacterized membrane protein